MLRRFSVLCLGAFVAACSPVGADASLLTVDGAGPARLEGGERFVVTGRGFPVGRPGALHFGGVRHGPGREAVRIDAEVSAVAASPSEVTCDADDVARVLGAGSFVGAVEVSFEAARGGRVTGRLDSLHLDVVTTTPGALDLDRRRYERATRLLVQLGLELHDDPPAFAGLRVGEVVPDGPAARAGITEGDVLTELDGAHLDATSDFLAVPGRTELAVRVQREGEAAPLSLRVTIPPSADAPATGVVATSLLVTAFLLVVLALLAPTARLTDRVLARAGAWLAALRVEAIAPAVLPRKALRVLVFSAALVALVVSIVEFSVSVLAGFLVLAALHVALRGVSAAGTGTSRLRAVGVALLESTAAALALGAVLARLGTFDAEALVEVQGAAPWQWNAARPEGLVAFVAFAECALVGLVPVAPRSVLEPARAVALGALATVVFLGGWGVGGAAGVALFALKTAALAAASLHLRATTSPRRAPFYLALAAPCAAWLVDALCLPETVFAAVVRVVAVVALVTLVLGVLRGLRGASRPRPVLQPFL